jgi:predicted phage-related endonuclease
MIGNVDRQILAVGDVQATGVLEIKCPGLRTLANIRARGLPDYMTVQLMHYLAVFGYEWGSFCLFNAENWDLISFDLEADQGLIDALVEKEQEFWIRYVLPQVAPPEDLADKMPDVPEVEGELRVVEGAEWRKAADELRQARELIEAASELEKTAKDRLQTLMADAALEAVEIPDLARLYWRTVEGRTQWKKTAESLANEADLNLNDFLVMGKPYRTFRPFFIGRRED